MAEVGAQAATLASAQKLSSWVGACPGEEQSAGVNSSPRSPKGNRHLRRLLNQAARAAVKHKGSIFEIVYPRLVPRLGHNQTIRAIAHGICQLIWMILNKGVRYEERGPAVSENSRPARTSRMIRTLQKLATESNF
jgi:transposase